MLKNIASAILLAAVLPATVIRAQPQPGAEKAKRSFAVPAGVQAFPDLEYGKAGERALRLDLYLPEKSEKPLPLIIWIHGGAWMAGSKEDASPALRFATKGFAVAHVGYRLSQEAKFPAQIHDCKAAVRWLRANAAKYHLDPKRFAAWGSSAGGHLVALLGVSGGVAELDGNDNELKVSSSVQAVVDWFGPTDFLRIGEPESDIRHNAPDSPESKLIGAPVLENKDKAAQASPVTYISKNAPPFLIMHGDHDRTVPYDQSELLHAALKKAGVDSTFITIKGAGHGFDGPEAITPVQDFLTRCLN